MKDRRFNRGHFPVLARGEDLGRDYIVKDCGVLLAVDMTVQAAMDDAIVNRNTYSVAMICALQPELTA